MVKDQPKGADIGKFGHFRPTTVDEIAFGYPRDFLTNKFVYVVISPRAGGLSIGVNVNPIHNCNLDCAYCEVDRSHNCGAADFDTDRVAKELRETLELVRGGWLRQWPRYKTLPDDLLQVRHVALSGDGEPTLSEHFVNGVEVLLQTRASEGYFKIVLVTNSTALDRPNAQKGINLLKHSDEVWAKLDGGTQAYLRAVNGPGASLQITLNNILAVGRRRPVVIQSLFPAIDGKGPSKGEINEYALRLKELKQRGAEISLVQIYSATRPVAKNARCGHLPLKDLSQITRTVRQVAGLRAEMF